MRNKRLDQTKPTFANIRKCCTTPQREMYQDKAVNYRVVLHTHTRSLWMDAAGMVQVARTQSEMMPRTNAKHILTILFYSRTQYANDKKVKKASKTFSASARSFSLPSPLIPYPLSSSLYFFYSVPPQLKTSIYRRSQASPPPSPFSS